MKTWGPFLESAVNFSGPKSKFQTEKQKIRARVLVNKLLHFVSLTDSFITLNAKLLNTLGHKGHYASSHNIFRIIKYAFQIMHNTFQIPRNIPNSSKHILNSLQIPESSQHISKSSQHVSKSSQHISKSSQHILKSSCWRKFFSFCFSFSHLLDIVYSFSFRSPVFC